MQRHYPYESVRSPFYHGTLFSYLAVEFFSSTQKSNTGKNVSPVSHLSPNFYLTLQSLVSPLLSSFLLQGPQMTSLVKLKSKVKKGVSFNFLITA